jgi:hypothetical protein
LRLNLSFQNFKIVWFRCVINYDLGARENFAKSLRKQLKSGAKRLWWGALQILVAKLMPWEIVAIIIVPKITMAA